MAEIVTMPKLGFDMAEGTLMRWVVNEGEPVQKGKVLAEIETDKATVEVESNYDGIVVRHLVQEGVPVPVGDPIAVVGAEGEQVDVEKLLGEIAPKAETGLRPSAPTEEAEALPREAETEKVQERQERQPETAPAAVTAAPPAPPQIGIAEAGTTEEAAAEPGIPGGVRASPVARRLAEEKGIDLRQIKGSGPQGRITKKDVESYRAPAAAPAPAPTAAPAAAPAAAEKKPSMPLPEFAPLGPAPADERIPLPRLRAAIGRRMVESKNQAPHFYVTHEYDVAALLEMRKQVNAMLPDEQKISVNDFIVKAVALALRQFPNLNAALQGGEVVRFGHVNIGVAVALEGGLMTVVCRDADRKPLRQIAMELKTLVGRAREGKVRPDDVEGSTFSISNMGMYDVESFVAIINPPEAAILAVGSAREVPVVKDGMVQPGMRMKATISIDHRVSDGAEGARFLQHLEAYIHEPLRLFV